jgi:hypothetical protein
LQILPVIWSTESPFLRVSSVIIRSTENPFCGCHWSSASQSLVSY